VKRYLFVSCLLLVGLLAAACGAATNASGPSAPAASSPGVATAGPTTPIPGSAGASTAGGPAVTLQFWHGQSQSQQTALNDLINKFNASHPNIKVVPTYQGTYSDIYKKVTAAIAGGSPPDLAVAYPNDVANYLKSGAVIPLDDLMKDPLIGFSAADLQDVYPSFIDHYPQANNQVYSLAFMRSLEVMYYNADLLKAVGFSQPPATWDDFMKACAAIVQKSGSPSCYELNTDASRFVNWVYSRGGKMLNADGKSVAFDQQPGIDTMNWLNDMFRKNYATVIGKAFQDQTDFALGKIAFTFGSSAGLPYYAQAIKESGKVPNWGIAPSPHTTPNPALDAYGPSVAIFKTTPDKQRAAFIFLKWLMDAAPNAEWVQATQYFPARQSTRQSLSSFIQANPLYGQALNWVQYGQTEPNVAAWNPIRNYLNDALTAVANGTQAPDAALKGAAQKANAALAGQ
jgi:multiple sugar transport system substrate-binding protein